MELKQQVLPKSPSGAAVRYALNQWQALNVYLEDELEIDNGATERANRDIAVGRGNWTFFGSDAGGRTAAILRTFIASCKRSGVEPFAWLGRAFPHRRSSGQPDRGITASQLEAPAGERLSRTQNPHCGANAAGA